MHQAGIIIERAADGHDLTSVEISNDIVTDGRDFLAVKLLGSSTLADYRLYGIKSRSDKFGEKTIKILSADGAITASRALYKAVVPALVTKVIIAADEKLYNQHQHHQNPLRRSLGKLVTKGQIIGDLGQIILVEPFNHGVVDENTEIVIAKADHAAQPVEPDDDQLLDQLKTSQISLEEYIELKTAQPLKNLLAVVPLNSKLEYYTPVPAPHEDPEIFAYANYETLVDFNCISGDYIKIKFDDRAAIKLKLFALVEPNHFSKGTLYISPALHVNLNNPQKAELQEKLSSDFSLAKQVTISRVASYHSLNRTFQQVFVNNLKTYFESNQRVVTKNSVIPIPIDALLARSLYTQFDSKYSSIIPLGNPNEIVWFKVIDIVGDSESDTGQYLVNPQKTKLVQTGLITDFQLPSIYGEIRSYLGLKPHFEFLDITDEKVFSGALKLRNLISTSQGSSLSLKTCVLLTSSSRNVGKSTLVHSLSVEMGISLLALDGYDLLLSPGSDMKIIGTIKGKIDMTIKSCQGPMILFIRHLDALVSEEEESRKDNFSVKFIELIHEYYKVNSKLIVIGSVNDTNMVPNSMKNLFNFTIEIGIPSEIERQKIFEFYLSGSDRDYSLDDEVSIKSLSLQSAGLSPNDLVSIIKDTKNVAYDRYNDYAIKHVDYSMEDLVLNNGGSIGLKAQDFETSINNARNAFSESIGAPKIPNVKWEDVGGLDIVKGEILDTIELPLKNPYLFSNGLKKRSGILFYGPPGTGKTLLAKAIATNFSLNFFSVKGPELLNMYIGESESNVRKVFQKARDAKPCVVFFDELDSVAPKRGNQGDSGGVMDRIVSQLLSELDGMSEDGDGVFVVGATNRPDLLDEALLRPGRFDKMLYLGISDTHDKQLNILKALTRKFSFDPQVDLHQLVQSLPFNYTGADFYALSSDAMLNAMTRKASEVDEKIKNYNSKLEKPVNTRWWLDNIATKEDTEVLVQQQDLEKSKQNLVPSVSIEELQHYLRVRDSFEGGKKIQQNGAAETSTLVSRDELDRANGATMLSDDDADLYEEPTFDKGKGNI